jgi:K+-sensing histidine kinase KdpD
MTLSALPWCDRLALRFGAQGARLRGYPLRPDAMNARAIASGLLQAAVRTMLYPVIGAAMTTLGLLAVREWFSALSFEPIIYLIPVVICAIEWGLASAVVCVLASALLWDLLFVPPLYSLAISDPNQIVEMALFLFVALITSNLAARARNEADASRRREKEIHNLFEFSRQLALCSTASDLVRAIQEYLSVHLGCRAYLIRAGLDVAPHRSNVATPPVGDAVTRAAREMTAVRESSSRLVVEPETQCVWVLKAIASRSTEYGILAVNLGRLSLPHSSDHVDSLLAEAGATLARIDAASALSNATARVETEALRTALFGTASHELRSPVAAILGIASVLDEMAARRADAELRSLVDGVRREAKRLDADIQNLLDTVRITDAGITPHLIWTDPADCLAAAIRQRADRISDCRVKVEIEPGLPLLKVDAVLLEQAVGQMIENAAKYSPPGSEIAVAAHKQSGEVVLSVADHGAGLTGEEASQLFRRGVRGRRHVGKVPGLGLGLWIACIFVSASGGTLSAHSPGPGLGTTMSIRLPIRQTAGRAAAATDAKAS